MFGKYVVSAIVAIVPLVGGFLVWQNSQQAQAKSSGWIAPAEGQTLAQGKRLYDTYCASCHGAKFEGQFNWRQRMTNGKLPAPPHDVSGHTWHHPDAQLIDIIKQGLVAGVNAPAGYQSDMPGFAKTLSDEQIKQILGYIKTSWNQKALNAQREVTLKRQ